MGLEWNSVAIYFGHTHTNIFELFILYGDFCIENLRDLQTKTCWELLVFQKSNVCHGGCRHQIDFLPQWWSFSEVISQLHLYFPSEIPSFSKMLWIFSSVTFHLVTSQLPFSTKIPSFSLYLPNENFSSL